MGNYIANSYTKMMDPIYRYNDPLVRERSSQQLTTENTEGVRRCLDPYINAKNKLSKYNLNKSKDYCLKFDRILDSENQIYIGIGCRKNAADKDKTLNVIRIGDYTHKFHRLLQFTEKENKLKYDFERNIKLIVKKLENNDIHLELFDLDNDRFISKNIDPFIVKHSKTIGFQSKELDKIFELFAGKIE